jgi:hypothetical protein
VLAPEQLRQNEFTTMLDLLDEYIELRGWNRYRIDGRGGHGANQDDDGVSADQVQADTSGSSRKQKDVGGCGQAR